MEDTEISKQILQIKQKLVKNPKWGRLISLLFTKRVGVESGTTKHKSIQAGSRI